MTSSEVLVVMPTLGQRQDTMRRALASLGTTQPGVDIVVVAPAGRHECRRLAAEYGASFVEDPGTGLSGAMNSGLRQASGQRYVAWLNDDDYLLPGGLALLFSLLETHSNAVVAYGGCRYETAEGQRLGVSAAGPWAHRIQRWGPNLVPQPASLMRLEAMSIAGGYDEQLKYSMDLDMFLRLRQLGPFLSTRREVAVFQWHADSISVAMRDAAVAEAQAVKRRYLPRQLHGVAPVWDVPVRLATRLAGGNLQRRAGKGV